MRSPAFQEAGSVVPTPGMYGKPGVSLRYLFVDGSQPMKLPYCGESQSIHQL